MNLLGREGGLEFRREAPEPLLLPAAALNVSGSYITVNSPDWWLCDAITVVYGGGSLDAYLYRDPLDRLYLHSTPEGALNNTASSRLSLSGLTAGPLVICARANVGQLTALRPLLSTTVSYETPIRAYPSVATAYSAVATAQSWVIPADLNKWSLNISSPTVETGAVGESHSSSEKVIVSGSGSIDFLVRSYTEDSSLSSADLLRLVMMVSKGAKAEAKFIMKRSSDLQPCSGDTRTYFNGGLYYNASILLTESSLAVSPDELLRGSANFMINSPVRLCTEISHPTDDPNFTGVSVLLHMNGSDGSTTFVDSSSNKLTILSNGPQIRTTEFKFNGSSAYFDGGGGHLSLPESPLFNYGNENFTIECFINTGGPAGHNLSLWSQRYSSLGITWRIGTDGKLNFFWGSGSNSFNGATTVTTNTWLHVALTREGYYFKLWVQGALDGTSELITASMNSAVRPRIGSSSHDNVVEYYYGYMAEYRITKGIARYTKAFTPPTTPFPNS